MIQETSGTRTASASSLLDDGADNRPDALDGVVAHAAADEMFAWARELYPIHRSLTGPGVRATLDYLGELVPGLERHRVPSGTSAFDWTVPDEWILRDAFVEDDRGDRLIDVQRHGLHVLGYSTSIDAWMTVAELDRNLHSLPERPDDIPYVTSYYARRWGFCLSHAAREQMLREPDRRVHVVIDATLAPGHLDYADLVLPGSSTDEVLFSADICHPWMGNNEVSGLVLQAALARWITDLPERRLTYRFVFVPETIGSLVYMSTRLEHLRAHTKAGFVLTCVGDDRTFGFLPSRRGTTQADRVARHVLRELVGEHTAWSFLDRGSDERQYCAPGIDLPVCSVMRSKYASYPEYHTSADDMELISRDGLARSFEVHQHIVRLLEANQRYRVTTLGEPQLGRRGLYPVLTTKDTIRATRAMMNLLAYADGSLDLVALAETIGVDASALLPLVRTLVDYGLLAPEG